MSLLVIVGFVALLFFVTQHERRIRENEERHQQALRIAKYFGNDMVSLFRFEGGNGCEYARVWALVKFDPAHDSIESLSKHSKYFVVGTTVSDEDYLVTRRETAVRLLLRELPYSVSIFDAPISFEKYRIAANKSYEM